MRNAPITPLPELNEAGSALLVGGTFDPPHLAHTELARLARDSAMPGGLLCFVPAARSPHKEQGPAASDEQRATMLELATQDIERSAVWTDEIDRAASGEPSYWVTTLERARMLVGESLRLAFLIGADQAVSFDRWYMPERILELAEPVVINRAAVSTRGELAARLAGTRFEQELLAGWCEVPSVEVSSTAIRAALSAHEKSDLAGLVHSEVASFIRQHNLYTGRRAP